MKIITRYIGAITMMAAVFLSSCSVEYRTRQPRPVRHHRVIVVGMADQSIREDATGAKRPAVGIGASILSPISPDSGSGTK